MRPLDSLEEALGVSFQRRELLRLAIVHSSYANENPAENPESNERLEFLGDALLGLVVASDLYQRNPGWPEGELTSRRSSVVRGETLAEIAESLGLGRYLLMGRGEEASGGRERPSNLAAAFEAVVGALLLDQGYEAAREFVLRALAEKLAAASRHGVPTNPKSMLQELVQSKGKPSPVYRIVEMAGEDQAHLFTAEAVVADVVVGRGTGRRKSAAEQEAALDALKALGDQA
jgi:ribonuclease-3